MRASRLLNRKTIVALLAIAASTVFAAEQAAVAEKAKHAVEKTHEHTKAPSDAELIASAMRAAPAGVAKAATIVAMGEDGKMRTLRKGTNGFTCMPDNPTTPGPDPMCMDANAMEWANAWMGHKTPPAGKVGFMYMLEGGTDASNTDPYATKPEPNNHWIKTGPHVMIVGAEASFYDAYPKNPDPDTTQPYIMWAGTPYQHLMAPIR
ncbi:hypothetical protein [Dokdonella soli]|uniref:Uncharacterized protein n=1 Tax=Dokdonella soli TaxID=529810 RepID=A0ABN1IJ52_9GAMM